VNFKLEIGELVQEVTVAEDVPVVNTTTSSTSGVVSEREIGICLSTGGSFDTLSL